MLISNVSVINSYTRTILLLFESVEIITQWVLGAEPTDSEIDVYAKVSGILEQAPRVLQDLKAYTGAGESIREVKQAHCVNLPE